MAGLRAPKLPPLERETLGRVIRGDDPWNGFSGTAGGSGRYSKALSRLKEKGYVAEHWDSDSGERTYEATPTGEKVYAEEPL